MSPLALSGSQILSFRQRTGCLNQRLPASAESVRRAAWAGLQDSMPRAALLSIHARVQDTSPASWEDPALVQLWGPRFSDYVIAAQDLPVFSLGRLPDDALRRARAYDTASRLHAFLDGRRMPFRQAGHAMGVEPNSLRYAAATGTVLLRWSGAGQPVVWAVPPSEMDPRAARRELARRYLHIFGPGTPAAFSHWAGVKPAEAAAAFEWLRGELTAVHTPIGDAWILAGDEAACRSQPLPAAPARLLPSGDAYFLLWGADREILLPDARQRAQLWTSRVWPGAVLVGGEIVGVWRRSGSRVSISAFRALSPPEWEAVESEALSMPLPGIQGPIAIQRV